MPNKIVNVEGRTLSVPMDATPDEIDELTRPKLDPTTAGQANSLAPAFTPSMPSVQDIQNTPATPVQDAVSGFGKQVAKDVLFGPIGKDGKAIFSGTTPDDNLNVDPNSAGEKLGAKGGMLAEYALPGGAVDASLARAGAGTAARMLGGAALNAGISATHGDAPAQMGENAALGAAGPLGDAAVQAVKPSVTSFLLRNLVKNTPENPGVTSAVGSLVNRPFTKGGLLNKVNSAASDADTAANSALSNYSGPNFDARPGLQMIEDAKTAAAAQGHPQEYIDSLNQLGDAIKQKTGLDATGKTKVSSRTNPANLGLQKFQDTIARVKNVPADIAGDVGNKLSSQLDNVPGYANANNARNSLGEATSQLSAPTPPAAPKSLLEKLSDYLPLATGAGGAAFSHGNPVDMMLGAALGAGAKGLSKAVPAVAKSAPFNTAALAGFNQLAPGAVRGAASVAAGANDNSPVMVRLPNGQVGHIQRWEVLNAVHNGATVLQ